MTELIEKIQNIVKNPSTTNTLNQNPYKRSEKYSTSMYQENSLQLICDEKIHQKSSLHQLTMNKMQFGDVSRALKSVVLGKLDNTNLTSHALAVVKSLCNGTPGS